MVQRISGLHHVSAITADAQANIDFYTGVLGLRLVKVTVNFDDPRSYHLYYGDDAGRPGTLMTFFASTGVRRGRHGAPQTIATAFTVPRESLDYWAARLASMGVAASAVVERLGDRVLELADPDGTRLELVAPGTDDPRSPRTPGLVPLEHAIRGFHGVTLAEEGYEHTAELMTKTMGYAAAGAEGNRFRYAGAAASDGFVDVLCVPDGPRASLGAGIVHHVAFRAESRASQDEWRRTLVEQRHNVSPVMDRQYFHSIYFREPGGVLFEIATDAPGFTVDEPLAALGSGLRLPPRYESRRAAIEASLPRLRLPKGPGA